MAVMAEATGQLRFVPMVGDELRSWLELSSRTYVRESTAAGNDAARTELAVAEILARVLVDDQPADGHLIGALVVDTGVVGHLWVGREDDADWMVWDIEIAPQHRGRGYGRQAMLLAEELARAEGGRRIELNVFGRNDVARALYRSLGYAEVSVHMRKDISPV
jgi:ribosomal protein S18 acetylase RimI-like enzyme